MTVKSFKINYSNIGGSNDQEWQRAAPLNNRNNRPQDSEKRRSLADLGRNWSPSQTRNDNRKVSSNECPDSNFNRNNIDKFFNDKLEDLKFDQNWTVANTMSIYYSPEPNEILKNFVEKFMLECFPNLIKWFNGRNKGTFFPISIFQYSEKEYFLDMLSGSPRDRYKVGIFKTIKTDSKIGKAIKLYNSHMGSLHRLLYKKRKSITTSTPTPTPTSDLNQDLVNKHLEKLSKLHFENVNIITSQWIDFEKKYNKGNSYDLPGNSDSEIINNNQYISYIEELNQNAFLQLKEKNFYFIDYSNFILGIKRFEKLGLSGDPWWGNFHARMITKVISFFVNKKIDEIKNRNEEVNYKELQFNFYLFTKKDSGYHDPYNRQYEDDNIIPIPIKFTIEDKGLKKLIREGIEINSELSLCTNRKINNEDKSRLIESQQYLDIDTTNQYYQTIIKIGEVSERTLKNGRDKSALHSITSFDDACLLKKYAIMKEHFKDENDANFYLISSDHYKDRTIEGSEFFSETLNFFNHNEDVHNNLLELDNRMNTYNNNQQNQIFRNDIFIDEIVKLAKKVSVAPFIERSIKYDVNILNDRDIIFTSEKEKELGENEMLTDYKFYIHSLPIFDRNFKVTYENPNI